MTEAAEIEAKIIELRQTIEALNERQEQLDQTLRELRELRAELASLNADQGNFVERTRHEILGRAVAMFGRQDAILVPRLETWRSAGVWLKQLEDHYNVRVFRTDNERALFE